MILSGQVKDGTVVPVRSVAGELVIGGQPSVRAKKAPAGVTLN
jgi:hypothetical protein